MLAIGLTAREKGITRFEIGKPAIQREDEVLVRVIAAGIDGTDRKAAQLHKFDPPKGEEVIVLGHEAVGLVEEVGDAVLGLRPGDMVVPTVRRGCGLCAPCLNDMSDFCQTGLYTERGLHRRHGYFTEYFVDEERYLVKVPEGLPPALAVLTEPLSISVKAIAELRHIQQRMPWSCPHPEHRYEEPQWGGCKNVLVIGAGSLGLLTIILLRIDGLNAHVAEVSPETSFRVELAKAMDAHYIGVNEKNPDQVAEITGDLDLVVEAAGATDLALRLVTSLGPNGAYILTGIPEGKEEVCVEVREMFRKIVKNNQVIFGSVNSNRSHFEESLERMTTMPQAFVSILDRMVTSRYPLDRFKEAFETGGPDQVKVVFDISQALEEKQPAA
ncbi:MAG: alcohol dehydrogenase catalytic domain-containing protein [Candidatus Aquicultorales bacterium]